MRTPFKKPHWSIHGLQQVLVLGSNILSGVVLARSLGPAGNGVSTYLYALCAMILPILETGTKGSLMREAMGDNYQRGASCARAISPIIWGLTLLGLAPMILHHCAEINPLLVSGCMLLYCLGFLTEGRWMTTLLTARKLHVKLQRDAILSIIGTLIRCTLAATFYRNTNAILLSVYACYGLEGVARGVINRISLKDEVSIIKTISPSRKEITSYLLEGLLILPIFLGGGIMTNYGSFLIKAHVGTQALGTYGLAQKLAVSFSILSSILYERSFHKTTWKTTFLGVGGASLLTLGICAIIPFIYGEGYRDTSLWLIMLIIPSILQVLCATSCMKCVGKKKTPQASSVFAIGTLLTCGVSAILIPSHGLTGGIPGACIALTIGYLSVLTLLKQIEGGQFALAERIQMKDKIDA